MQDIGELPERPKTAKCGKLTVAATDAGEAPLLGRENRVFLDLKIRLGDNLWKIIDRAPRRRFATVSLLGKPADFWGGRTWSGTIFQPFAVNNILERTNLAEIVTSDKGWISSLGISQDLYFRW